MKRIVVRTAAALALLPVAALLILSLRDGLTQYIAILQDTAYWQHYLNSLKLTGFSLLLALPLGILTGLMLALLRTRLLPVYLIALLMPFQVITLPLFQLAISTGLYDTHAAIILLTGFAPLAPLICWTLYRTIPSAQWDAALLDTASLTTILRKVILPQLLPGLSAMCILLWSEGWNMVEQPLIFLMSREKQPLSLLYNDIASSGGTYAGAVLYALPIVLLYGAAALYLHKKRPPV